jgi:hypothetical protein
MRIIWNNGKPDLLVSGGKDNRWDVLNGGWTLLWDGHSFSATVEKTKDTFSFGAYTDVPESVLENKSMDDYNEIMCEVEEMSKTQSLGTIFHLKIKD